MTKGQIVELIWKNLGRSDRFSPRQIALHVDLAMNDIFYNIFRQDINNLDIYKKKFENVSVLLNTTTNKYYIELPKPLVQFPNVHDIINISTPLSFGSNLLFVPISQYELEILPELEQFNLDDFIKFNIDNGNIVFYNMTNVNHISNVDVRQIVAFSDLDDTDDFYVPAGQGVNFFNIVTSLLKGELPPKRTYDNNPNTL